jgi:hypothetical protein
MGRRVVKASWRNPLVEVGLQALVKKGGLRCKPLPDVSRARKI